MIEFSVGVDDLGLGLEPVVAPGTAHTIHVHDAEIHDFDILSKSLNVGCRIFKLIFWLFVDIAILSYFLFHWFLALFFFLLS
jgi:hypothetical protein